MSKPELIALIQAKKDEKVAAVAADFDALIAAANSLEVGGDVDALQAQIVELQNQLSMKEEQLAEAQSKLSQVNDLAKQIDAVVPDA